MKYTHILSELWTKPTLLTPAMHAQLCELIEARMNGIGFEMDENPERDWYAVGNVAVLPVQGVIAPKVSGIMESSGVASVETLTAAVEEIEDDESIEGMLMDVDSPGGAATATPELAGRIASMSKPVVAVTDGQMASGAYWLSAGADAIYATQSASVGSIGVYMAMLDVSRMYEMAGVKTELIKRGKFKATGITGLPLSEEQRAMLQERVDTIYDWFTAAVRQGRGTVADETMQGQVFFGPEAVEVNLTDAVGGKDEAMDELQAMIAAA